MFKKHGSVLASLGILLEGPDMEVAISAFITYTGAGRELVVFPPAMKPPVLLKT
jgi:hypothetical protein